MGDAGSQKLQAIVDELSPEDSSFSFEFEAASALGREWYEMRGARIAGADGRTERLTGLLRVITDRVRDGQRLHYLATRDELTGHLNRTSLRAELAVAIEAARAANRSCSFLVASIDR